MGIDKTDAKERKQMNNENRSEADFILANYLCRTIIERDTGASSHLYINVAM